MKAHSPKSKVTPAATDYNKIFRISLIVICLLVFGNSLKNKYNLDDELYTNGNPITKDGIKSIPKILTDFSFKNPNGDSYQYRPVTMISFAVETQLFGQKPLISHFISLLLYTGIVLLLFNLFKKMLPDYNLWFIFSVCALFAVHPIHTEVVDNIKCRDELLALLFALLSLKFVIRYFQEEKLSLLFVSYLLLLLSLLSKTSVYPFMASIPLILYFFFDVKGWKLLLPVVPFIFALLTIYLIRQTVLQHHQRALLYSENPLVMVKSFEVKTATAFFVLGKYIQLLLIPDTLRYYYGFKQIDITHWTNLFSIFSLLLHVGLGGYALYQIKKKTILSFSILFYLVHLSMYSNLVVPAPGIMGERFAFIASIGFCLALVYLIFILTKTTLQSSKPVLSSYATYTILLLFSLYSIRSIARNSDWKTKDRLFSHDMEDLQESMKANMIYGELLHHQAQKSRDRVERNERQKKSLKHFTQATSIQPNYDKAWSNKGSAHYMLKQYDSAVVCFKKSIALEFKSEESHLNLAAAYEKLNQTALAVDEYQTTLELNPSNPVALKKRAALPVKNIPQDSLISSLKNEIVKDPTNDRACLKLGRHYLSLQDTTHALAYFELAVKRNPDNHKVAKKLAVFYNQIGNVEKARHYNRMSQKK
ncbi:MAG: tetratricopeptide repeat protein [Cytophagaceae bacterium]|jgi:tetratricopeptide (TPR) repeat protein|nr:tetratricopeptide repeat protein [Cytophagaceae bacterium]